jgi:hypothetical protein
VRGLRAGRWRERSKAYEPSGSVADSPPLVTADRQFLTIDFARPVLGPGDHRTAWLLSDPWHPRVRRLCFIARRGSVLPSNSRDQIHRRLRAVVVASPARLRASVRHPCRQRPPHQSSAPACTSSAWKRQIRKLCPRSTRGQGATTLRSCARRRALATTRRWSRHRSPARPARDR